MLKIDQSSGAAGHKPAFAACTRAFLVLVAAGAPLVSAQAQAVSYSDPIVITKGGTYTGNYRSTDSGQPAVLVNTNDPVVLDGCNLAGAGNLIQAGQGADLTVRNCRGQGLAPSVDNQAPGRFLDSYRAQRLVVEHNELVQTSGIVVNRWGGTGASGQTLTVRYNRVRNIDGRWRNGGSTRSSFLILNTVQRLAGVDVSYNEVVNAPNQSLVEDNINLYNSSGTASSPLRVHDNFVRGAYPFPATDGQFTGTGLTTDGDAGALDGAAGYIEADHNQFVSTCNAAMNIAAGHDVYYHDNRLVNSGLLPDGSRLTATYAATAVFNYYQQLVSLFFNNRIQNNTIGFVRWGANNPYPDRQDLSPGNCATCTGTVHLPNPVTLATEDNEATLWAQKLQQAGVVLGPLGATAAPTPPVAATGQVANPGFEADGATSTPTGWQTSSDAKASYSEAYAGAHTGSYHGTHYRPSAYEVYTYQVVSGLANGTYAFSAWVKSSGGQAAAQMRASNYGGPMQTADLAATPGGVAAPGWVLLTVPNIAVTNGQCEIGFYSKAGGSQSIYFDDVTLAPQQAGAPNAAPTVALSAATSLTLGQALALSATATDADGTVAKVEFFNGTAKLGEATAAPYQLSWTPSAAGTYALTAVATDNAGASTTSAAVAVAVAPATPAPVGAGTNLVVNPGLEAGGLPVGAPAGWQTATGANTNDNADYTETYPGAHAGLYHGTQYRPDDYEVYTYQTISNLPAGTYTLRAWVKSTGGQPRAEMRASNYGGDMRTANLSTSTSGWTLVQISDISVTSGRAEIGFYSKANGGQWLYFDDVEFVLQPAATPTTGANTVLNPSFDNDLLPRWDPRYWTTRAIGNTRIYASFIEAYPGAHTGLYHGTQYRPEAFEVYTYQTVRNLPAGSYTLRAWVKNTGGQAIAEMRASNYGGSLVSTAAPTTADGQWVQISVPNIAVSNGQCEIGFYSKASGGQSLYYDDVELVLQSAASSAATSAAAAVTSALAASSTLFPNPADGQVTVSTNFEQATAVTLVVTDMQGTPMLRSQQQAAAGDNQFVLDTSRLPSGIYALQIQSSQPTRVERLEVRH
ncbi:Ig-like domain-containing protein [Hymenobacter nivis]|uniref:T9SS C-terminal target domain-containing protein n=1 Tax=Hymenobacter nivis TaxID=1850093 RepID=A0A502GT56_9BACT|nr:Ig-like domain-containing protein [Hymenobacter nivis]TPG65567.1 T9SS C-terminal target domain-containing protein [Hymenobacter nivis]